MFFLNLTAGEFFGLLGVLGGTITALYFLDRSKRRKVVSTLQFWVSAKSASEQRSRKKVNQPWSLLLQLVSLLLLLLAIAQLQWGTRPAAGRDHVLLIDTSSWSAARVSNGTVLRRELADASQYLSSLPAQDRVLLVRADALAAPATVFTTDREQTQTALRETVSSFSALDLTQSLKYAEQAQRWSGGVAGEIVYIGPGRIASTEQSVVIPANLRILSVPIHGANCGIRRMDVRHGEGDPPSWHAQVALMNYGSSVRQIRLRTQFAGTRFAVRAFVLPPRREVIADYNFVTNTAGELTAEIEGDDALSQDNRAALRLAGNNAYSVTAYTKRAGVLRPLLAADKRIVATFLDPASLSGSLENLRPKPDLVILDGISYPNSSSFSCLWINPPQGGSPFHVKDVVSKGTIKEWNSSALMAAGLHSRTERIQQARIFNVQANDLALASMPGNTGEGPVVILRPEGPNTGKMGAIGFDPLDGQLRFTVTTPLLFANLLEWMAPEAVRTAELETGHVGSASVELEPDEPASTVKVTSDQGVTLPFTVHERTLQLFADKPTVAHIVSSSRSRILALTLPDVAQTDWTPAASRVATGLPAPAGVAGSSFDLWHWLVCLAFAGLLAEWLLFKRSSSLVRPHSRKPIGANVKTEREEELVAQ